MWFICAYKHSMMSLSKESRSYSNGRCGYYQDVILAATRAVCHDTQEKIHVSSVWNTIGNNIISYFRKWL